MTNEEFNKMKADLKEVYTEDLCEESLSAIDSAENVSEFISVLHKFAALLPYKNIPSVEWARKWFCDYIEEANANGAYIDQNVAIKDPTTPIALFGKCNINIITTKSDIYHVLCMDNSKVNYLAYGNSLLFIRLRGDSKAFNFYKDKTARVRVRKV